MTQRGHLYDIRLLWLQSTDGTPHYNTTSSLHPLILRYPCSKFWLLSKRQQQGM